MPTAGHDLGFKFLMNPASARPIIVSLPLVSRIERIFELKRRLQDKEGIPPALCRIIFAGKELLDSRSLEDYNMGRGCNSHVVPRKQIYAVISLLSSAATVTVGLSFAGLSSPDVVQCNGAAAERLMQQLRDTLTGQTQLLFFQEGRSLHLADFDFLCSHPLTSGVLADENARITCGTECASMIFALAVSDLEDIMAWEIVRVATLCGQQRACGVTDDQCTHWLARLLQLPQAIAAIICEHAFKGMVRAWQCLTLEECLDQFTIDCDPAKLRLASELCTKLPHYIG